MVWSELYILDSVYMPGTRVAFSILYITGNLRSDVCESSSECAISSVGMACVFLLFSFTLFQDQFLIFSKIFSCVFLSPDSFLQSF